MASASIPAPAVAVDAGKVPVDRLLEERKKAKERDEASKKQRDDAERTARNAQACEALRAEQRSLESGMRIASVAANGEREFMSDETREKRTSQVKQSIDEGCQG